MVCQGQRGPRHRHTRCVLFSRVLCSAADSSFHHTGYQTDFVYNPKEKALKVPNLIVTGTQTTINTANLQVEDRLLDLALVLGGNCCHTALQPLRGGIVVNIGATGFDAGDEDGVTAENAESTLPRFIWDNGFHKLPELSNSVLGWKAAYKGTGTDGPC